MTTWHSARTTLLLVALVFAGWALITFGGYRLSAEGARTLPPPTLDEPSGAHASEVAVLAGGCFWGVQGVFQHVAGVTAAVSGYAGGRFKASYEMVSTGTTGHAESVQVTFDPRVISYGRVLQVFFSVAHDPTQLNQQGPDTGTQYRSAIFPTTDEQTRVAVAYIAQLDSAKAYKHRLATTVEMGAVFFPAEAYHQNYLTDHPTYPYIAINDLPKLEDLRRLMPRLYRITPVLVSVPMSTYQ